MQSVNFAAPAAGPFVQWAYKNNMQGLVRTIFIKKKVYFYNMVVFKHRIHNYFHSYIRVLQIQSKILQRF